MLKKQEVSTLFEEIMPCFPLLKDFCKDSCNAVGITRRGAV